MALAAEGRVMRGFGYLPNERDHRDKHIWALVQECGTGAPIPFAVDNSAFLGDVRDQSMLSSCVPTAGTKSIFGFCAARGIPCPELATLPSYALTRGVDMQPGDALVDLGSIPRNFFRTAASFGVVSEARAPFDPSKVNDLLPLDFFCESVEAKVKSYHTIFETGLARINAIHQTVNAKLFPCYAQPVDAAFQRFTGDGIYQGITGEIRGYHYMVICGYSPDFILVRNSYGPDFGFGGLIRISNDFIASDQCRDFMAANAAPASAG